MMKIVYEEAEPKCIYHRFRFLYNDNERYPNPCTNDQHSN